MSATSGKRWRFWTDDAVSLMESNGSYKDYVLQRVMDRKTCTVEQVLLEDVAYEVRRLEKERLRALLAQVSKPHRVPNKPLPPVPEFRERSRSPPVRR